MQRQRVVESQQAADVRVVCVGLQAQRDQVGRGAHLDGWSSTSLLQLQQLQTCMNECIYEGIVNYITLLLSNICTVRTNKGMGKIYLITIVFLLHLPYQSDGSARREHVRVVQG